MTRGVGGSRMEDELEALASMRAGVEAIDEAERRSRIEKAQGLMQARGNEAMYLDASTSLYYFTGLRCRQSERLHGAIIPAAGEIVYLCPTFEKIGRAHV